MKLVLFWAGASDNPKAAPKAEARETRHTGRGRDRSGVFAAGVKKDFSAHTTSLEKNDRPSAARFRSFSRIN